MWRILFAILLLVMPTAATLIFAGQGGGPAGVEAQLAPLLPRHAKWALVVLDIADGREVAALGNALDDPLVPGSLVKLFVTGAVLEEAEQGGETASARLQRQLRAMNVHSLNEVAGNYFLALGAKGYGRPVTREKGRRAVVRFLSGLGMQADQLVIADGSGLAKENRVTARFVARYLREVARRPWYLRFRETLPRPGMEGTVKDIGMTDKRFRVKTGHLDNVFSLAGYGVDPAGHELAFAYIVNAHGEATDRARSRGKVLRLLAEGAFR